MLVATTLGAVAGPNLVQPTGRLSEQVGIPALGGPFILAAIAYALAGLVLMVWLRPDPLLIPPEPSRRRRRPAQPAPGRRCPAAPTGLAQPERRPAPADVDDIGGIRLGAAAMVLTQIVMVAVMTMTPVHMRAHGHGLGATGLVIAVHIALMFLPSPLTGRLADRYGSRPVLTASGGSLLAAGLLAATAPEDSVVLLALALGLLGLGWNLGLVGGTTLVTNAVSLIRRARTQGRVDLAVALAGATGGFPAAWSSPPLLRHPGRRGWCPCPGHPPSDPADSRRLMNTRSQPRRDPGDLADAAAHRCPLDLQDRRQLVAEPAWYGYPAVSPPRTGLGRPAPMPVRRCP